jgi:hypothetical protein
MVEQRKLHKAYMERLNSQLVTSAVAALQVWAGSWVCVWKWGTACVS